MTLAPAQVLSVRANDMGFVSVAICFGFNSSQRSGLGDVAVFKNCQPVTAAEFITKCSLFVLLVSVIHRLELKSNSEQKVENIFVAPLYCQTACWLLLCLPSRVFKFMKLKSRGQNSNALDLLYQHKVSFAFVCPSKTIK
jgi:hypothetical protein